MAGVRLAPADGGCPVALPPGETVLGRGPLLGITDKRVSRKHAILEVEGGQVRIKPIHVNPCFYQSSENGHLLPLEAHEWHVLKFGDSFSLLVDKYIFKVLSAHPVESTVSPSLIEPACSSSEIQGTTKIRKNETTSRHLFQVPPSDDRENEQSKSIQRKRVLPSWMLEGDFMVQRLSDREMKKGGGMKRDQGKGGSNIESLKIEISVQKRKRLTSEEMTEDCKDEEQYQGKKGCHSITVRSSQNTSGFPLESTMRNLEGNGKTETKKPGSSMEKTDRQLHNKRSKAAGQICSKMSRIEETEKKEQITGSSSQQAHWGRTFPYYGAEEGTHEPRANLDYKTEISDSTGSIDTSESSKQIKHKRAPCMYGTGCYRKNPVHFQQFSHPIDDDYHEMDVVTQPDSDDRPECPYGTTCYRKNPQHKLEYKHSALPVTERRTRQRTSKNGKRVLEEDSNNDGLPNEYDLNDSFIDDDEEECEPTDDDSDWEPNSEENNEDVETLLKEACRFVNTKK
ncbi:aprataxin and PNK-like factor isoform X3 [Struthio camelus]|uniref:aprataxin and PNK-like factor isoform X3 n=1 Tax=Struthio camelus TaxID=8801 RepID=UPI003603E1A1